MRTGYIVLFSPFCVQAKAIENELARTAGKALINFTVHGPRGATPFGVKGFEGQSLKQASGRAISFWVEKNN